MGKRVSGQAAVERRERIVSLYSKGLSLAHVGAEYGISEQAVKQHLVAAGVPRRPVGRPAKRPVPDPRACGFCGGEFVPKFRANPGIYCGRKCTNEAKRLYAKPNARPCEVCGEPFAPPPNVASTRNPRFCSVDCKHVGLAEYPALLEPRACKTCGKEVPYRSPSAIANGAGWYCDNDCFNSDPESKRNVASRSRLNAFWDSPEALELLRDPMTRRRRKGRVRGAAGIRRATAKGRRPGTFKYTAEQRSDAERRLAEGQSNRQVALYTGLTRGQVEYLRKLLP